MEFDVWSHDLMELGDTQRARDELSEFRYLDGERGDNEWTRYKEEQR